MTPEEKRVNQEISDLEEKYAKLWCFIKSDKYKELNDTQKSLLRIQLQLQDNYIAILKLRLKHWNN